jgi:hypothetical protein
MQKQMSEKAKLLSMPTMGRGDPCTQYFWVVGGLARRCRAELVLIIACLLVACAPTFESHIDSTPMPALDSPQGATRCASTQKLAALDPMPQLPDVDQSQCPLGSGLSACFTHDQDVIRQRRFKILDDDRDYCRDAYDRARARVSEKSNAD